MRYLLTLFLIALVSTSEIIDKADEIKEFGEYEDVELQSLFGLIPIIGKIVAAGFELFAKAKAFIADTRIFEFAKGVIGAGRSIFKGAQTLFHKSKIFTTGKQIFDKGRRIINKFKGMSRVPISFKKDLPNIYKRYKAIPEIIKIYRTYTEIIDTYNKGKEVYKEIKDYYNKVKDFYDIYLKKDNQEQEQNPQQNKGVLVEKEVEVKDN
jgi:hypothetical protein